MTLSLVIFTPGALADIPAAASTVTPAAATTVTPTAHSTVAPTAATDAAKTMSPYASTKEPGLTAEMKALIGRANDQDVAAETCLGHSYLMGVDLDQNPARAVHYLQQASDHNSEALALLPYAYSSYTDGHRFSQGYTKQLQELAAKGDANAEAYMGEYSEYGDFYDSRMPDLKAALSWYEKAAAQDDATSEAALAQLYRHGWGVKADAAKADAWRRKAANHRFDCDADFVAQVYAILRSGIVNPQDVTSGKVQGKVLVRVPTDPNAGVKASVITSSGNAELDNAALLTVDGMPFPTSSDGTRPDHYDLSVVFRWDYADPIVIGTLIRYGTASKEAMARRLALVWADTPHHTVDSAQAYLRFSCITGKPTDVAIVRSSGDAVLDALSLKTLSTMKCPKPLSVGADDMKILNVGISDPWDGANYDDPLDLPQDSYGKALRAAVRKAQVLPQHVLVFGAKGDGVTQVAFDVIGGKPSGAEIVRSSGDREIDAAALKAVHDAKFPVVPKAQTGKSVHVTMHVNFQVGSSAPTAITAPAPAAVSGFVPPR